ncbi:MAG: ABC transporter ATP-binding protein [Phycisphaerales bacterium]|nr:ABC transporter ATP-binding protein [Phycisphaerales bacterium]
MLRFQSVTRTFEGRGGVCDISLTVDAGSCVAVMGASGCGKTTLLRIAAGLESTSSGSVVRSSEARGALPRSSVAAGAEVAEVGVCFQEPRLLPWRSALRNVALPLELRGVPRSVCRERASAALAMVGLDAWESAYPAQLSGGMRMRVGLARALVTEPKVLLLDEPCSALDVVTRFEIEDHIARLQHQLSMTVLLVTHAIDEAAFLANQVVVLTGVPGRVASTIRVNLSSREPSVRNTPEFESALAQVLQGLHAAALAGGRSHDCQRGPSRGAIS